jgi:hypothetical protein
MTRTIEATYDGEVLRPDATLPIAPNTRVRVTVEVMAADPLVEEPDEQSPSCLDVAASLQLDGPRDWARNLDKYLYGDSDQPRG